MRGAILREIQAGTISIIFTRVGSSSDTELLLNLPFPFTTISLVYAAVVFTFSQVYSKYSPGSRNASV